MYSDDKWTFRLNLCEYLLYAFCRPYEIEPCPQYIYHFCFILHAPPNVFLSLFKKGIWKFISQIRLKAHLILLDPCFKHIFWIWILVKHYWQSVWCFLWQKCIILFFPCTKDVFCLQNKNLILGMSNICQIYWKYLSPHQKENSHKYIYVMILILIYVLHKIVFVFPFEIVMLNYCHQIKKKYNCFKTH